MNAGSSTTTRWNGITVGIPSTTNSSSARRERSSAWVRSRPETISFATRESKDAGDGLALVVPAVQAYAGSRRRVPPGQGAGGRHEVGAAVLGVDPELDRVPADLRVVVPELLAGGDPEHLAHEVEAGHLLGDGVLDLEAGVDLEEGDGAVPGDEELAGAGADVPGLLEDRLAGLVELARPGRRRGTARAPPRPASGGGAAASSRGSRRPRRCRAGRPGTGSRRAAACRGTSRRSTRRDRTR